MTSHFLYELKARLEHILKVDKGHLKDPEMFKNEIESIYRDLCIEVDPYGTPGDDDEPISDGVARGSGGYMSPECVNGMECGPASDIWSIGSIAHVLLTGHVPFVYELDLAAMQFQRKDAPMVLQNDSNFDITILISGILWFNGRDLIVINFSFFFLNFFNLL